jgi:ribosome recycling factor
MIPELKKTTEQKMQKSLEALKNDLGKVRTGRAHAGILDHVQVDYYGSMVPISQVANINLIDARTIGVTALGKEDGGGHREGDPRFRPGPQPLHSGRLVRVPMPALTEERRKDLIKVVRGEGENARWPCATCAAMPTTPSRRP